MGPTGLTQERIDENGPGWNTQLWMFGSKEQYDLWLKDSHYAEPEEIERGGFELITHVVESVSFGDGGVWLMNARDQL